MDQGRGDAGQPNVVLTGFMATGKSTVGRLVAAGLRYGFVDTDRMIEERHGSIPEIFASDGEEHFRAIERGIAEELAELSALVISTGGGLMLDASAGPTLAASGRVFCLTARVETIWKRVGGPRAGERRPMLAGDDPRGRLEALVAERAARYAEFEQITTDDRRPSEVAEEIVQLMGGRVTPSG
jgi:shikimate kinase